MTFSEHRIDLHMHTTISDGTDSPEEILKKLRQTDIGLFSVTDHDAIKGAEIIPGLRKEGDPVFIPGVEFSCKDDDGKYHILGYGYDPQAPSIRAVVETGHEYRLQKVKARLDYLHDLFGFVFPENEVKRLFSLNNPGKPHIGNLMVRLGYVKTKEEGISKYIDRLHYHARYVAPETAIRGILDAGGIPVLAHPTFGSGNEWIEGEEMDIRIRKLLAFGLQGLEAYYSKADERIREEILYFAGKYHLYVTAGSDYHGKNKTVALGQTGMKEGEMLPEGMQRFLEALDL